MGFYLKRSNSFGLVLQAVHDAEAYLATSQIQEKEAREKLAQVRLIAPSGGGGGGGDKSCFHCKI